MSTTSEEWIYDVGLEDFEQKVGQASFERPIVIDFWSESCPPCRVLAPILTRLITERKGDLYLAKINVDEFPQIAGHFQVQSVPTVVAVHQGRLLDQFVGLLPEDQIREFLDQLAPSEADGLVKAAAAMEEAEPEKAEAAYRQILESEPTHEGARVGLARVLIALKKTDEVEKLLEPLGSEGPLGEEAQRLLGMLKLETLDAGSAGESELRAKLESDPENAQVRYELGCSLAASGKHEEALEMLHSAAQRDFSLAGGKVREAMVQVFYAIGTNHPLADEYRKKLMWLLT